MCLGGGEHAGRPAGSTDGAEACHSIADDGHILTWDPQLSGSHTSCSGLNQHPPRPPHADTHTQGQGPGHCLFRYPGRKDRTQHMDKLAFTRSSQSVSLCVSLCHRDDANVPGFLSRLSLSHSCPLWLAVHLRDASYIS
ncbi:unnamed protein product [Pleuronectes platessa]|uniref:Uncharacterized protein n=1 Tax=Pleuronectes platessa TaxID=8262 RepID=A0A9N7ZB97_PLEPL|nr:unnamed protein product [Pleuronectes platessa]